MAKKKKNESEAIGQLDLFGDCISTIDTDPIVDDYALKMTRPPAPKKKDSAKNLTSEKGKTFALTESTMKRILLDIRPASQLVNVMPKTIIRVINGLTIEAADQREAEYYLKHGSNVKDIIADETRKAAAIEVLEKWKLSNFRAVIMDLCGGLMKALSTGVRFRETRPQFITLDNGKKIITSWIVTLTYADARKCAFGGLVDENGEFRRGVSEILKRTTEKELERFLSGKDASPKLLYYLNDSKSGFRALGEYAPIRFVQHNGFEITLELDRRYFPLAFDDHGEPTSAEKGFRYVSSLAGLGSIFEIGHYHLSQRMVGQSLPSTVAANRFYQTISSAFQFQSVLGISLKNDCENVAIRKSKTADILNGDKNIVKNRLSAKIKIGRTTTILSDMFSHEVATRRWREIQRKCTCIGGMLLDGLKTTGLLDEIKHKAGAENILIPDAENGVDYIEQYNDLMLIKVKPITRI